MFLDQKALKNLLLQLVTGWPILGDKMSGLHVLHMHVLYILNNRARAFLNGILTEEDGIMETFEEIRQN